jgi:hypothetical protein
MTDEKLDRLWAIRRRIAEMNEIIEKMEAINGDDIGDYTVQKIYDTIDFCYFSFLLPDAIKFLRSALKQIKAERDRLQQTFDEL